MTLAHLHRLVTNDALDLAAARAAVARVLPEDGWRAAHAAITAWPGYRPTPLVGLPGLARRVGIGEVLVKDEASRFGLGSFKALGGAYAVFRLVAEEVAGTTGRRPAVAELTAGHHRDVAERLVVTCTTDGNHGRSVAWGARRVGCRCVIYVHEGVSQSRADAIRAHGAEVIRAGRTYDESVEINARDAAKHGRHVIADTDPSGVTPATAAIMQGYRVLVDEALAEMAAPPTHVLLQVGCGGFAAAVAAHLLGALEDVPRIVGVEPEAAACLAPSIAAGRPIGAAGDLDTLMAGLSVGQMSWPAWEILRPATEAVAVIPDEASAAAMRILAHGADGDPELVSGESGAAGLAGLLAVAGRDDARASLRLDASSRVLLISTEGATDPLVYERIVGRTTDANPPQNPEVRTR